MIFLDPGSKRTREGAVIEPETYAGDAGIPVNSTTLRIRKQLIIFLIMA